MSRWRALIVVFLAAAVSVCGVFLLLAVNAEVSSEAVAASPLPGEGSVRTERLSPPGTPAPPQLAGRPVTRPLTGGLAHGRGPEAMAPPTFRLGGFPMVAGPEVAAVEPSQQFGQGNEDEDELQRQLATRRLAALERRVRAMNRRIRSMGDHGSTSEQLQSQKERMDALLEEIRQKREEQGMPSFNLEEEEQN